MKTTEHGIESSKDVENVYHMRLMALLQELVRDKGYKGAARVLEIDPQTVTDSAKTGPADPAGAPGVGAGVAGGRRLGGGAAAQAQRGARRAVAGGEQGHGELGKEVRRRLSGIEGEVAALRRDGPQGTGPVRPAPVHPGWFRRSGSRGDAAGRKPPTKPSMRREYPDLVTREPADDDEEIFGDAWSLIVEWRELKDSHPNEGGGFDWLTTQERLLVVELALLEEHGMTLPPEKQPLRGLDRAGRSAGAGRRSSTRGER